MCIYQLIKTTIKSCFVKSGFDENEIDDKLHNHEEYKDLHRLFNFMSKSYSVNHFINLDKNVYTDNFDVCVLIYNQLTNQSKSENEDNEGE
jgi:hypothetical protein